MQGGNNNKNDKVGQTCWKRQIGHKRLDFGTYFNQSLKN
jgi:hypothetical protein